MARKELSPFAPDRWIREMNRRYPSLWTDLRKGYADPGRILRPKSGGMELLSSVPDWCIMPTLFPFLVMTEKYGEHFYLTRMDELMTMASTYIWRCSKGVYRFAPEIYQALVRQPLTGDLPQECLYYLPEWAVYIETPELSYERVPICPDVLQRSAVLRILLRIGQVKDNRLLRQTPCKFLQRALRFARVRRHRYRFLLCGRSVFRSLLRDPIPDLLEHAQLSVVEDISPLLTALTEARPVLIPDDLLLFLQQGGEPVHRGLQRGYLLHERVKGRLRHGHFIHAVHRLPNRSSTPV